MLIPSKTASQWLFNPLSSFWDAAVAALASENVYHQALSKQFASGTYVH